MFDKTHVWLALEQVEAVLLGKYGMKTLDPRYTSFLVLVRSNDVHLLLQ